MSLHSPVEFAQIVDSYIDGWRKNGWMPECRANNLPGWSARMFCFILFLVYRHNRFEWRYRRIPLFAVNYNKEAQQLGIDFNEFYTALLTDGEVNPPEWNIEGRQVNV